MQVDLRSNVVLTAADETARYYRTPDGTNARGKDGKVYTNRNLLAYMNTLEDQRVLEKAMLKGHQACPSTVSPAEISPYVSGLDTKDLSDKLGSQFYSSSVMEATACITNSFIQDNSADAELYTSRIRHFLRGLKAFGAESVSGFALRGSLSTGPEGKVDVKDPASVTAKDIFVVKAPRNPDDADELVHECIVAFHGTNSMRRRGIPNFAYVYGAFFCSAPLLDTSDQNTKEILAFCNSTETPVCYAIYENINNAMGIGSYTENHTAKEIADQMLQTFLAIQCAKDMEFSHQDLHTDNVMVRKIDSRPFSIMYQLDSDALSPGDDGVYYFKCETSEIATIIDFGSSHIKAKGGEFGHCGATAPLLEFGVRKDKYNPYHDQLRLLGTILFTIMRSGNMQKFNQLSGLLGFFTDENHEEYVKKMHKQFFSLPWMDKFNDGKPMSFIVYMLNHYAKMGWESPLKKDLDPTTKLFDCSSLGEVRSSKGSCQSTDSVIRQLGMPTSTQTVNRSGDFDLTAKSVKTIFDFYNFVKSTDNVLKSIRTNPRSGNGATLLSREAEFKALKMSVKRYFKQKFVSAFEEDKARVSSLIEDLSKSLPLVKVDQRTNSYVSLYPMPTRYEELLVPENLQTIRNKCSLLAISLNAFQDLLFTKKMYRVFKEEYGITSFSEKANGISSLLDYIEKIIHQLSPAIGLLIEEIKANEAFLLRPDPRMKASHDRVYNAVQHDRNYEKFKFYWVTYPTLKNLGETVIEKRIEDISLDQEHKTWEAKTARR